MPTVSVVIPTYNYAQFLGQAIESVLASHYPDDKLEIIVVDDGSTDDTAQIMESYVGKVRYIQQENDGKASATARGIAEASGKYFFTLDADDYFLPDRIQKAVEVFENDPKIVHVSHPAEYIEYPTEKRHIEAFAPGLLGHKHRGKELLYRMFRENITVGAGSTFSARLTDMKTLSIPRNVDMFIDEYLLLHTLTKGDSYFVDQPLSIWRIHGENFSNNLTSGAELSQKENRTLDSMKAVLSTLDPSIFGEELPLMYELKLRASELHIKERENTKSISDIFGFFTYLIKSAKSLKGSIFSLSIKHNVPQRLLPTSLVRFLKTVKK